MTVYHLCHGCTVAIVNDDYSAFSLQDTDTDYERVIAFVETVGYLVDAGRVPKPPLWECEACEQLQDNPLAYAMETL